jgi:hypothetical protein
MDRAGALRASLAIGPVPGHPSSAVGHRAFRPRPRRDTMNGPLVCFPRPEMRASRTLFPENPRVMATGPNPSLDRRRLLHLVKLAAGAVLAIAAVLVVPSWVDTLWSGIPRWLSRKVTVGFLWTLLVAYGVVLAAVLVGIPVMARAIVRARRRRERRPVTARLLLLGVSTLFSLALLEGATAAWQVWAHRVPEAPTRFIEEAKADGTEKLPTAFDGEAGGEVYIVVIGESSARGEPYHPNLSVGQILGWQLEKVFPGRTFRVDVKATGGLCMEQAVERLDRLERRPDAVLVYCGHNEFQAHYSWGRAAKYYVEEVTPHRRALSLEVVGKLSPLCGLIAELLDRQTVDAPPPPVTSRHLVDVPTCTAAEYRERLDDFHRRLEAEVAYCEKVGALPLMVIPAGNDGDFEPDRSVLAWSTPKPEREAFARDFEAARDLEGSDPARAADAYRALLERQPDFAETHYRLARLLEADGRYEEADRHYVHARDLDGLPMRCPSDFQEAYRQVARRHDRAVLVDGPEVLRALTPHGILDEHQFHDAQHPTLLSYIALTQDLLNQLHARKAFGWPEGTPAPTIDPSECAEHFGLDAAMWAEVCRRSASFYEITSGIRYDSSDRNARAARYREAAEAIASGTAPEDTGVPGVGVRPTVSSKEGQGASPAVAARPPSNEGRKLLAGDRSP